MEGKYTFPNPVCLLAMHIDNFTSLCTYTSYIVGVIKQFAPSHELNEHVPLLTALRDGIA